MNEMVVFQKEPQIFAGILFITVCFTVLIYIYNIFVKCTNVKKDNCCKKTQKNLLVSLQDRLYLQLILHMRINTNIVNINKELHTKHLMGKR